MNILAGILFGFLIAFLVWQKFEEHKETEKKRKEQELENMKMASKGFVSSLLKAFKVNGQVPFCSAFKPNPNPNPNNMIWLDSNHIQWKSVLQNVTPTQTESKDFETLRNDLNMLVPQIFVKWQSEIPILKANLVQMQAKYQKYVADFYSKPRTPIEEMQLQSNVAMWENRYAKLEREVILKQYLLNFSNAEIVKIIRSKRDLIFEVKWV